MSLSTRNIAALTARELSIPARDAYAVLNTAARIIQEQVAQGETVNLRGFLSARHTPAGVRLVPGGTFRETLRRAADSHEDAAEPVEQASPAPVKRTTRAASTKQAPAKKTPAKKTPAAKTASTKRPAPGAAKKATKAASTTKATKKPKKKTTKKR